MLLEGKMGGFGWRALVAVGLLQLALGALFVVSVSLRNQNAHAAGHGVEVHGIAQWHETARAAVP